VDDSKKSISRRRNQGIASPDEQVDALYILISDQGKAVILLENQSSNTPLRDLLGRSCDSSHDCQWLLTYHKLAGDLVVHRNWGRIVAGQVKAAIAGETRAAEFCKELAWPENQQPSHFLPSKN
jgi:hypothetical protein